MADDRTDDPGIFFYQEEELRAGTCAFDSDEQAALDRINRKVAAGRSLAEMLDLLFDETREVMPCDRIGMAFLDDDGARLVAHWARATYEPLLLSAGYAADMAGSSIQGLLGDRVVRLIGDLPAYLRAHPGSHSTAILVQEGVRSSMTCPLTVEGRRVGVLFRSSRDLGAYGIREARLHAAMAERLAQAVEKGWHIEQLSRANRSYVEMLRFVSHELKSPLASVIMQSRALLDGLFDELPDGQKEVVEGIRERGEYLLAITDDYLNLARFEGGDVRLNALPDQDLVEYVCRPAMKMVKPQLDGARINLTLDAPAEPVTATFDATLLKVAITNLLSNAIKYGNSPGRIRLQVREDEESCRIAVWNAGPGFPEEMRGHLFQKFSRLPKRELLMRPGTGVGLFVVWQIARLHGGSVDARSREGSWAEFTLDLPKAAATP